MKAEIEWFNVISWFLFMFFVLAFSAVTLGFLRPRKGQPDAPAILKKIPSNQKINIDT